MWNSFWADRSGGVVAAGRSGEVLESRRPLAGAGRVGGVGRSFSEGLGSGHGLASDPPRGPSGLKIIASRKAIDIECLAGKVEIRHNTTLHRFRIDFIQWNASAGDELLFIHAFPRDVELGGGQDLNEAVGRIPT